MTFLRTHFVIVVVLLMHVVSPSHADDAADLYLRALEEVRTLSDSDTGLSESGLAHRFSQVPLGKPTAAMQRALQRS